MYICIHVLYIHVYAKIYREICMYVYMCYIYIYMYKDIYAYTFMYTHTHIYIYTYITHTQTHTHTHTNIYIYIFDRQCTLLVISAVANASFPKKKVLIVRQNIKFRNQPTKKIVLYYLKRRSFTSRTKRE